MIGGSCVEVAGCSRLSARVRRGVCSAVGIRSARMETSDDSRSWRIVRRETRWRPAMRWMRVRLAVTRVWKASSHGRTPAVHLRRWERHRIRHCPRPIENWFLGTWHQRKEKKSERKEQGYITSSSLANNHKQKISFRNLSRFYLRPGLSYTWIIEVGWKRSSIGSGVVRRIVTEWRWRIGETRLGRGCTVVTKTRRHGHGLLLLLAM